MTIAFSIGKWGGFYRYWGYTKRVCLGWMAVTFIPADLDELLVIPDSHDSEKPQA